MDEHPSRPAVAPLRHGGNPSGDRNPDQIAAFHFGSGGGGA
jgi:hypothetical protein